MSPRIKRFLKERSTEREKEPSLLSAKKEGKGVTRMLKKKRGKEFLAEC